MNLDELQSVRDRERQTDKLQQLRETFYEDTGEFIRQLREQRERAAERADDPFDAPEVNRLSDEIDTAEKTVEAIYEKRVGKIVKAASFAAADLPAESDGMTAEETELFETLVEDIKTNRQHVMDVLDGTEGVPPGTAGSEPSDPAAETEPQSGEPAPPETQSQPREERPAADPEPRSDPAGGPTDAGADGVSAADVMGGEPSEPAAASPASGGTDGDDAAGRTPPEPELRKDGGTAADSGSGVDRETVRITRDVGDFLGFDEREYDLSENDVVTLPSTNVEPLVSRDAAERLD
ncbi:MULTISPECIES: hypothetical protein [Salinibaculum]|uniref:hypothetical protein n=1 Tax=Salinibaculum TaxID=2732368 RepID=UPI0030D3B361